MSKRIFKNKILALFLSLVLIVGLCNSLGISFVKANSDDSKPDVTLSVKTDKAELRLGEEVKVTVSIDSFKSSIEGDTNPLISEYQVAVPIDTDIFEFVSKEGGLVNNVGINYYASEKKVKSAVSYDPDDEDVVKRIYKQSGNNATSDIYSFTLKVKDDVKENSTVSFDVDDSRLILKNFKLPKGDKYAYTVNSTPATVNVIAKEVSEIEVLEKPVKTTYFTGSSTLDVTGGKIKVHYTNGTTEQVDLTSDMCSDVDLSTPGKKTVTVNYDGKTSVFEIEVVDKQMIDFELSGVDNKKIIEGTDLDITDMSADVIYDDGTSENIKLTKDMITYNKDKVGIATVQVKIGNITKTFDITVEQKSLESISINAEPDVVNYVVGNRTLDVTGAKITVMYNNNTSELINVTSDMCCKVDFTTVGKKIVTVTYGNMTTSFTINVVEKLPQSVKLNGVDEVNVLEGNEINTEKMSADITYNDGSVKNIAITQDMLIYNTDKVGKIDVIVKVEGLTAKFNANVIAKKAISFTLNGAEGKSVTEGMKLDISDITADVVYNNGTKGIVKVIDDMVTADTSKVGDAVATVVIDGVKQTFTYEVKAKILVDIDIVDMPQTIYLEGQKFVSDGLKVEAVYNNGTRENITEFVKISGDDLSKAGIQKIVITYTGNKVVKETSLEVNVKTWDAVNSYKSSLKVLLDKQITKSDADSIKALRNLYEELSDVEKAQVDIVSLENLENTINRLINEDNNTGNDSDTDNTIFDNEDGNSSVETGDTSLLMVIIAMLVVSAGIFSVTVSKRKKIRSNNESI